MYTQFQFALYLPEHNYCVSLGMSVCPSLRMTKLLTHIKRQVESVLRERETHKIKMMFHIHNVINFNSVSVKFFISIYIKKNDSHTTFSIIHYVKNDYSPSSDYKNNLIFV